MNRAPRRFLPAFPHTFRYVYASAAAASTAARSAPVGRRDDRGHRTLDERGVHQAGAVREFVALGQQRLHREDRAAQVDQDGDPGTPVHGTRPPR